MPIVPPLITLDYLGDMVRGAVVIALIGSSRLVRIAYRSSLGTLVLVRSLLIVGRVVLPARSETRSR